MDAFDNFKKLVKDIPDYETRSKFLSAGFEIMIAAEENAFDKAAAYQLAILADDIWTIPTQNAILPQNKANQSMIWSVSCFGNEIPTKRKAPQIALF